MRKTDPEPKRCSVCDTRLSRVAKDHEEQCLRKERLERMKGFAKVCDMPGDGEWKIATFRDDLYAASPEHGVYRLVVDGSFSGIKLRWEKVDASFGDSSATEVFQHRSYVARAGGKDG